ncbi:hypothetical protein AC625_08670 [Peribacillus loiseleuriae]|uniref:Uncharacterized protein n=1 Tax=Peribacillus loiseleuriae TaxID=1679170 RepID=A0A0K9GTL1_9BACI|nr:hypothetical protein AC625_08670 [Peribacillus loiseleuriae]
MKAVLFIGAIGIGILYFLWSVPNPKVEDNQIWNNNDTNNYIDWKQNQNLNEGKINSWSE